MLKLRPLRLLAGLTLSSSILAVLLSGCSLSMSKEERAAKKKKGSSLFRKEKSDAGDKTAWKTSGNPKWKKDIDDSLTRARNSVPGNRTGTNPSGPPPRNPSTNVKIDLAQAKATTYHSVETGGRHIAITFDDGPHPRNTPRLLDMLKQRNIKATFFVVATNAKRYPQLMQRMVAEGHEIGNHTITHGDLSKMSNAQIKRELDGCRDAIIQSCGVNPRLMRAPYGALRSAQKIYIKDNWGYPNIDWSVDPEDWRQPGPSVVANRILSNTRPGGIVLVHDIHAASIVAMPQTLDGLLHRGFRFVTTSQLISLGNQYASAKQTAEAELAATAEKTQSATVEIEGVQIPAVPLPSTEEAGDTGHARIEE